MAHSYPDFNLNDPADVQRLLTTVQAAIAQMQNP